MSRPQYLAEHSELDHLIFVEWLRLHDWQDMGIKKKDPYECIIGEHVSQETWDRWEAKIAGAKWRVIAGENSGVTYGQ